MLRRCNNSHLISSQRVVFPNELIEEVLSFLPVKSLLRSRCTCKSLKILISDPIFVKLHLKRSARNPHIALVLEDRILPFPVNRLLDTISISHADYPNYQFQRMDSYGFIWFVGSCNGLLCFARGNSNSETMFYLWNPTTKTLSNKISFAFDGSCPWNFTFGYDNSAHTYKIVAFNRYINVVEVFNSSNNVWRNIEGFPVIPFQYTGNINYGVYVSNTINWLAALYLVQYELELDLYNYDVDEFVIVSLDLTTETYCQLSPPLGFAIGMTSIKQATLAVLMDTLCFSHDFYGTHFVIWQMKEFGVQESWSQLFKISYQILPDLDYGTSPQEFSKMTFSPVWLSKNGDTLILAKDHDAILYNLRDNRAVKTRITDNIEWFLAKDYVESLAPTC